MILVDVFVPGMDRNYDFQLNETIIISAVIEEIGEMISQKEQLDIIGDVDDLLLCDRKNQIPLPKNKTLAECGVMTGESLILV